MKNSFGDLSYEELLTKREELKQKYRSMRFDKIVGHLDNPLDLRIIRRSLARLNTLVHEYHLRIRGGSE